jgi:hypothetical protein
LCLIFFATGLSSRCISLKKKHFRKIKVGLVLSHQTEEITTKEGKKWSKVATLQL